jgi:hypothetical protein
MKIWNVEVACPTIEKLAEVLERPLTEIERSLYSAIVQNKQNVVLHLLPLGNGAFSCNSFSGGEKVQ